MRTGTATGGTGGTEMSPTPTQRRRGRIAAWAVMVAYVGAVATTLVADNSGYYAQGNLLEGMAMLVGFGAFTALGALMIARRPGHVMGRLFAAIGLMIGIGAAGDSVASVIVYSGREPGLLAGLLAWPNSWYWYALLVIVLVFIPLLFPDGHLPSPRWRWLAWAVGVVTAVACLVAATGEHLTLQTSRDLGDPILLDNPFGITGVGEAESNLVFNALFLVPLAGMVGALASVALRFRRARGVERQQLKLFAAAVSLAPLGILSDLLPGEAGDVLGSVVFAAMIIALPTSIAVAVLRYRLWDVDRIISRTVSYTLVTIVLAGVYASLVLGAQALGPDDAPDVVVAASTLVVAGLFRPLRGRVQAVVDRRFARTATDGRRTVEAFAARLRDEVDLGTLRTDLVDTTRQAVHPRGASLWLPTPSDAGGGPAHG